jgi:hypothetical protein
MLAHEQKQQQPLLPALPSSDRLSAISEKIPRF